MISKVVLAKLSPTMEEGTIVSWNKNEGDAVKVGDVLAVIETDKANMEMESLASGVLRTILVPAGGKAPIGALIGIVADPNEDISSLLSQAGSASAPSPAPAAAPAPVPAPVASPAPPAAPALVAAASAPGEGSRVKASPLARSIAAQQNVPLAAVTGSGPGGRIVKRDIEAYVSGGGAALRAFPSPAPAYATTPGQSVPLSSMRKAIARRLTESVQNAPHFYVTMEVDMDKAVALREQILAAQDVKVSYNDFIIKCCAAALRQFPMVNASWGNDAIATHGDVHVGVAVALPDGLITPVVRHADQKSLLEIAREARELAVRARDKKLKPEEYQGSTFTISNLGMYDVDEFTAIINPPDSAILAVGAVKKVPVVDGDTVRAGHRMKITLSSDHRVIDGAVAAQFLQDVRKRLENPVSVFL